MGEPDLIELFARPLAQSNFRYFVSGSVAAMLYGEPRVTPGYHQQPASFMKSYFCIIAVGLDLLIAEPLKAAQTVLLQLPIDREDVQRTQIFPHEIEATYQQVFDATLFDRVPPGGFLIRDITLFSSYLFHDNLTGEVTGITVEMSTVRRDRDSLSSVFAENMGSDRRLFHSPSTIVRTSSGIPGHAAVDIVNAGPGFVYDPAEGNLLVEIRGLKTVNDFPLDAVRSSRFTSAVGTLEPGESRGELRDISLVMGFTITIPEPSTVGLVGLGLSGMLVGARTLGKPKDTNVTN